ncbi:histidine kinase [Pararobbsia silviterrae]|uniref:Histidine kinase domain-containing protein n=1 Tax=Pararobbsia silviterrae TaxID=1792498 RepID=A0A494X980_9BURK|nr:histidine kinase [Pararobbsia silviterrae]RKP47128.1 hypothetical protein D7S86_23585 [Pararobbsia silviterrae]
MAKEYPQGYLVVLFVTLVCVCLLGIEGWRNWTVRREELHAMEDRGRELAKLAAQQANDVFFQAWLVSSWVADENGDAISNDRDALERTISTIKRRVPAIDSIAIVDANGHSLAVDEGSAAAMSAMGGARAPLSLPDSIAEFDCAHACIQRPIISPWTGKLVIPMSMHVPAHGTRSDSVAGASASRLVLVTIDIEVFKEYYRSLSIGPSDKIFLNSDRDFTFVARPSDNTLSGHPIVNRTLFASYQAQGPVGSVLVRSASDGEQRLISYRRLADFPVFVAVGLSRDDLLARWWRDVAWHFGATLTFMSAVALIALHFMRQSKLRAGAERKTEAALQLSGEISGLSAYLEAAREQERKRIAMEVHDQLGQSLTALKIEAFLLKRSNVSAADAARTADEMIDLIDGTITTVRNVSNDLRPVALDYGIVAALQWLTADFAKRKGIACAFYPRGDEPALDDTRATAIFRLAQGALTNIVRHAQARSIDVFWTNDGATLRLTIVDDGRGFDVDALRKSQSYGLLSMRERARICGGDLSIESTQGSGTTVSLTLPLRTN